MVAFSIHTAYIVVRMYQYLLGKLELGKLYLYNKDVATVTMVTP